jgi:hypothetical protein
MSGISVFSVIVQNLRVVPLSYAGNGVKIVNLEELYQATLDAGVAWNRELRRLWSKEAGRARFDERSFSTPRLRQLHEAYRSAEAVYKEALIAERGPLLRGSVQLKDKQNLVPKLRKAA